jgi:CRP/FNR family transcriptional regulator, cyclic AMP receptor protein
MAIIDHFKSTKNFRTYNAGESIFDVGDPDDVMYGVKEGVVEIYFNGSLIETLGPGDIFGEKSLIDDQPHTTMAVAKTDCQVVEVNEERFLFLVHETPTFALQVMRSLTKRTRDMMRLTMS